MFSIDTKKTAETGLNSVQKIVGESLSNYFKSDKYFLNSVKSCQTKSLSTINAVTGIATFQSIPDFICYCNISNNDFDLGLAIIELKDTSQSPLEQLGQAVACASNVALTQFVLGLSFDECAVPVLMTNGNLYQFGWVHLLSPCFPSFNVTSHILSAGPHDDEIADQLAKMRNFCVSQATKLNDTNRLTKAAHLEAVKSLQMGISTEMYFFKKKIDIFLRYGFEKGLLDKSLFYQMKVYQSLSNVKEAIKPLGFVRICQYDKNLQVKKETEMEYLIFPMLIGYQMGVPSDESDYILFLDELKRVINLVHKAGVVHVDLYPSNIMWKKEDGNIIIRIVDWDAATILFEKFPELIVSRKELPHFAPYDYRTGAADPKCDYWFIFILSLLNEKERQEMNGTPDNVNTVFKEAVDRLSIDDLNGKILRTRFENWFDHATTEIV